MKIYFIFAWQFGIMFSVGINYEKITYITIEIPFLIIQILLRKPKNK